jgi:hypothetical protein
MKAKDFDKKFDNGEDIIQELDLTKAQCPGQTSARVNVDFPEWMVQMLDNESKRLGISRQAIIKFWIADKLKEIAQ